MVRSVLVVVLALGLAACDSLNPFGGDKDDPLPGERISVLLEDPELKPDQLIADLDVVLPPPEANRDWPQAGGDAAHVMNHLQLSDAPSRAWTVDIGAGSSDDRRLLSAPVVADGVIYTMDSEAEIRAFDTASGNRLWSADAASKEEDEGDLGGGIAYADGRLFVTTGYAEVLALDAKTGSEIWRERASAPMRAAPTVAEGKVFALTVDNRLLALSAVDGRPLWTHAGIAEVAGILGGASPAVDQGIVVVPHSSGELFALRTNRGRTLWSDSLSAIRRIDAVSQLADIRGHPVIDRGLVFAMSHSGRMVALDVRTGGRIWEKQIGGLQTPWVAGDFIFAINSEDVLFCLARENGRIRWVRQLQRYEDEEDKEDPILWVGPVLASDRLIVAGSQGTALSVSPYTGEILGRLSLPDDVSIAPIVANGTLYFLTDDADLVALR